MLINNGDVVPYNPYLTKRYGCHINVEIVTSLKSVKYLFKYVHKGHDRATLELKYNNNEIDAHVDARYVGPAEACWRLFGFKLHALSHNVERLAVHLPGENSIPFQESKERDALDKVKPSTLEAWFNFNKADKTGEHAHVHYIDIPQYCTWNKKNGWQKRQRLTKNTIGRMCGASPTEGERYFLYVLLLHVPGAKDWIDLKTDPSTGVVYETFLEAARGRGLLENEDELRLAMQDAASWQLPSQLRSFFANLLLNSGSETPAGDLWENSATA